MIGVTSVAFDLVSDALIRQKSNQAHYRPAGNCKVDTTVSGNNQQDQSHYTMYVCYPTLAQGNVACSLADLLTTITDSLGRMGLDRKVVKQNPSRMCPVRTCSER
jgi:hypothetical protein